VHLAATCLKHIFVSGFRVLLFITFITFYTFTLPLRPSIANPPLDPGFLAFRSYKIYDFFNLA